MRIVSYTFALILALANTPGCARNAGAQSQPPSGVVEGLDVHPGLALTLFASDTLLTNPTNIDIDARGRIWVTEAYNYRMSLNPGHPVREAGDRILILEDTDGDGRADVRKVFYQGRDIDAALGIAVLGNRVIVSVAPNVFVFTDEDGDDRADRKEVLFSGISGVQHDHGVHAFVFGPDGRLYFNFGNEGRQLRDADGELVVDRWGRPVVADGKPFLEGMVFRMNPDGSELEVLAHNFRNNYEVAVDAFGTLWQSDNDDDGNEATRINYVMEYGNFGFRDEMTGAGWRVSRTNMEEEIPGRHWHLNDPGVVPNVLQTGAGSPAGILVYEGTLLPDVFHGQMIHADAGPKVVRAYPVEPEGAGYAARIVNLVEGTGDPWFRPVDVAVAPDGSLFIADWYDPGIGGHQVADLETGRLFRVAPPDVPYRVPALDLETPAAAAAALTSPNLATRYLAWMRLHAWQAEAEPALRELWGVEDPRFRARALWLLGRIEGRGAHYVDEALADADPNIRITGLRLARQLGMDVVPLVRRVVPDPSPQVRREAALALRHSTSPEAPALWAALARQHDGADRWYLEALGIGAEGQWDRYFAAWSEAVGDDWMTPGGRDIVWRARTSAAVPRLAALITDAATPPAERPRYFRAFDYHDSTATQDVLLGLLRGTHAGQAEVAALALRHVDPDRVGDLPAMQEVLHRSLDAVRGTQAFIDLVARFGLKDQNEALLQMALADPSGSDGVSAARLLLEQGGAARFEAVLTGSDRERALDALTALGFVDNEASRRLLMNAIQDSTLDMTVRRAAVPALGRGWSGEDMLLEAVREERLPAELVSAAAVVLHNVYRGSVREEAARYIPPPASMSGRALPTIGSLATRQGDAGRGQVVFGRVCSACHVVRDAGTDFGPNLSEIGSKLSKEALYTAILQPDAGISFGYEGYVVRLKDGSQAVGYVVSETDDVLALRLAGGITGRYPKADIVSRTRMETSLMPSNLQQTMTEEELVDLVEFLNTLRQEGERGRSQ